MSSLFPLEEEVPPEALKPGKWRKIKHNGEPAWDNRKGVTIASQVGGGFQMIHTLSGKSLTRTMKPLRDFKRLGDLLVGVAPEVFKDHNPRPGAQLSVVQKVVRIFSSGGYARAVSAVTMQQDPTTRRLTRTGPSKRGVVMPSNVAVGDLVLVSEREGRTPRAGHEYEEDSQESFGYRGKTPLRVVSQIKPTSIKVEIQDLGVSSDISTEIYKRSKDFQPVFYARRGKILLHVEGPYILEGGEGS